MPSITTNNIQLPDGRRPTLTYYPRTEHETAVALRSAFSFFRGNADHRYSATVIMSLIDYADRIERCTVDQLENGATQFPGVITIETPFSYDEETETKTGGLLGCAVTLPDFRVLLATHRNIRRVGIGSLLLEVSNRLTSSLSGLSYWIHQENNIGQQFALAVGLIPYDINRSGAVLYRDQPPPETEDAVSYMEDSEIERRLFRTARRVGAYCEVPAQPWTRDSHLPSNTVAAVLNTTTSVGAPVLVLSPTERDDLEDDEIIEF